MSDFQYRRLLLLNDTKCDEYDFAANSHWEIASKYHGRLSSYAIFNFEHVPWRCHAVLGIKYSGVSLTFLEYAVDDMVDLHGQEPEPCRL